MALDLWDILYSERLQFARERALGNSLERFGFRI
jgi:hypothetical protein